MILRPYKALRESAARIAKLESENRDYTATVTNALIQAAANSVQEGYSSGIGPLARASVLKDLASKVEGALESESNASVGYLLPLPAKGDRAQVDKLRDQLAALDGKVDL